jgi:hypothetical protein
MAPTFQPDLELPAGVVDPSIELCVTGVDCNESFLPGCVKSKAREGVSVLVKARREMLGA